MTLLTVLLSISYNYLSWKTQESLDATRSFVKGVLDMKSELVEPIITPRFAPTCTRYSRGVQLWSFKSLDFHQNFDAQENLYLLDSRQDFCLKTILGYWRITVFWQDFLQNADECYVLLKVQNDFGNSSKCEIQLLKVVFGTYGLKHFFLLLIAFKPFGLEF